MSDWPILEAVERCYAGVDCDQRFRDFFRWLAEKVGSDAGDIALEYPATGRMFTMASFGFDPRFLSEYDGAYLGQNPWYRELEYRTREAFHSASTFSRGFQNSTYQNEWVRPQGLNHSIGAVLSSEPGEIAWIGFARQTGGRDFREELERLRVLLPHLRRAVSLKAQLGRAPGDSALLDRLACPAFLLDRRNRVVAANPMGVSYLDKQRALTVTRSGRLVALRTVDDEQLQLLLAEAWNDEPRSASNRKQSLALGIFPDGEPMVLKAVLMGAAGLSSSRLLLTLNGPHVCRDGVKTAAKALQLSPTEQEIAAWLAKGGTLSGYAVQRGTSLGTLRWHLKNIQRKTGTTRLDQLVSLLHRLTPFVG